MPTTLTPDIFFLFLLPPIIGEAGYFMPNRLFFDQLGTILLMAVVGTIFNRFRIKKLDWLEQFIMMYGGLRGGVAFALVLTITEDVAPHAKMFVTATLAMVYFTVFVQGITIGPLVRLLKVRTRKSAEPSMAVRVTERLMDQAKTGIEDILGDNSEVPLRMRNWYKGVADKYIKPLLLRPEARADDKMLETFEVLQTQDAMLLVTGKNLMVPDIMVNGAEEKGHINHAFKMEASAPGIDVKTSQ